MGLEGRRNLGAPGSVSSQHLERSLRRSLFLVDSEPTVADMYKTGLQAAGFEVKVHPDASTVLRGLESRIPDAVVLDWQLPGMFGDELLTRMRRDGRTMSLPVFILSDLPSPSDGAIDRAFAAGALAWLEKANTPPSLLAQKLEEALAARRESLICACPPDTGAGE